MHAHVQQCCSMRLRLALHSTSAMNSWKMIGLWSCAKRNEFCCLRTCPKVSPYFVRKTYQRWLRSTLLALEPIGAQFLPLTWQTTPSVPWSYATPMDRSPAISSHNTVRWALGLFELQKMLNDCCCMH